MFYFIFFFENEITTEVQLFYRLFLIFENYFIDKNEIKLEECNKNNYCGLFFNFLIKNYRKDLLKTK